MKTRRNYKSIIRITLFYIVLLSAVFSAAGCFIDKKVSTSAIDMIVVFNKDVPIEKSSSIMFEHEYIFVEGTDSSKGKTYFQESGPKYIVKVPKEKIDVFIAEMKVIPQIYEIYRADYSITKD